MSAIDLIRGILGSKSSGRESEVIRGGIVVPPIPKGMVVGRVGESRAESYRALSSLYARGGITSSDAVKITEMIVQADRERIAILAPATAQAIINVSERAPIQLSPHVVEGITRATTATVIAGLKAGVENNRALVHAAEVAVSRQLGHSTIERSNTREERGLLTSTKDVTETRVDLSNSRHIHVELPSIRITGGAVMGAFDASDAGNARSHADFSGVSAESSEFGAATASAEVGILGVNIQIGEGSFSCDETAGDVGGFDFSNW